MEFLNWSKSKLSQRAIPENLRVEDVVSLDRIEEGKYFESKVYISHHLMERKDAFDSFCRDKNLKKLYVSGPSGCGKTVFLSLLARMYAKNFNKKVLFVNFRDGQGCPVYMFKGEHSLQPTPILNPTSVSLYNFLENLMIDSYGSDVVVREKFDLVIYDGVRQHLHNSWNVVSRLNSFVDAEVISKIMFVSSLPLRIRASDTLPDYESIHGFDYFVQWERDDYIKALQNIKSYKNANTFAVIKDIGYHCQQPICSAVDDNCIISYVNYKYCFAGGNARFMFDYSLEDLRKTLKK